MVWCGIIYYGTLKPQRYCEKKFFPSLCRFRTRVKLPYSNRITLNRKPRDKRKTFYNRRISTYCNGPQGHLVYHQLSMCGAFIVDVWESDINVNSIADLSSALQQEWHQITIHEPRNIIRSMGRRCLAIQSIGWREFSYNSLSFSVTFLYEKLI